MTDITENQPKEDQHEVLLQAFKQFSLETERLEMAYQSLNEQFKTVQTNLHETHTKLYGKLAELDFTSSYLNAILSHMSQGILFIDLKGIVTTYNTAAEEILGVPQINVLLHSFWEFFPDDTFGFPLKEILANKQGPKRTFISWSPHSNKTMELEVEATFVGMNNHFCDIAYVPNPPVIIQGLLVLVRNITEFRKLQTLANRYERLKELGEMAARVAHEIRNPLGGIRGFAALLEEDLRDRPELQQMAAQIVEGADGLGRFVSNVLNYTRSFQPQFESLDLVPFIKEIIQLVQMDQTFHANISYKFHSSLASLLVSVDPQLFKSALLNLFVNALQAMPNEGTLTINIEQDGDQAKIQVTDTGVGISQENLDKIFSPFFTTKDAGTGLGLSEVYKVIQAHQGAIDVQSSIGKGTTFTIHIPLKLSQ